MLSRKDKQGRPAEGLTITMLRFIGLLVLLALSFGLRLSLGKQPTNNLEQTVKDFSRNMVDTTMGIERDFRRRQSLVDAKGRVIQAKVELFNRNTPEAAKELAEGINSLEAVTREKNTSTSG